MRELLILKLFCKDKSNWFKYYQLIKNLNLDKELILLFSLVESYYDSYPEHEYIGVGELKSFFQLEYSSYKSPELIEKLIEDIYQLEVSDSLIKDYIETILEKDTATKIINKLLKVVDESEQGLLVSVEEDILKFKEATKINKQHDSLFVDCELDKLIEEEYTASGINWRLKCLQEAIGPLRGACLVHVFARVETGKTSFLASEVTNFAKQLKPDECIIWYNNEEKGSRVQLRLYSAMLGLPIQSLVSQSLGAKEEFIRRGGNKIKVYDNAYISIEDIDRLCLEYNPRLIVADIADKVTFKGAQHLDGHVRLKELYRKFRELAKIHGCDIITAGQASAEGHGKKWLEMIHMDNSKTGKPGELDVSIGIGKSTDEGKEAVRYIHVCKNKLQGIESKDTVLIDTKTGRYSDMEG